MMHSFRQQFNRAKIAAKMRANLAGSCRWPRFLRPATAAAPGTTTFGVRDVLDDQKWPPVGLYNTH